MLASITRFIPMPYLYAGIAVVLIATHGLAYFQGWQSGMEKYYGYKSKIDAVNARIAVENEQMRREQQRIDEDTRSGWLAAVDYWKRNPVVRVQPHRCPGEVPGLSTTSSRIAGLQASGGESWITTDQCEQIANDSTLDREWIEAVKKRTDELHEASK